MARALHLVCVSLAVSAGLAAFACGSLPDPTFVPDCQVTGSCADGGGDGGLGDGASDASSSDGTSDAVSPLCTNGVPSGAIVCCGDVVCVSATSKKRCSDQCAQCEAQCAGANCCVDVQGALRCSPTPACL